MAAARALLWPVRMRIRFDGGTLVLKAEHGHEHPGTLADTVWDRSQQAWRVPAAGYTRLLNALSSASIPVTDEMRDRRARLTWKLPPLDEGYQHALDQWHGGGANGVLRTPPCTPRPELAIHAIARLGVAAICLVPTRMQLTHWHNVLSQHAAEPIGKLGDGVIHIADVVVATFASAITWGPRIGDRFGLIIVDEAHHVGDWCPAEALAAFVAPRRLGFTTHSPEVATSLERVIGPSIQLPRGDAALPPSGYELRSLPIQLDSDEKERFFTLRRQFVAFYRAFQRRQPDAAWHELVRYASETGDGQAALLAWRDYRAILACPKHKRAVIYDLLSEHIGRSTLLLTDAASTAHAIAQDLLIMPLTGEIGRAEREQVLAELRSGERGVVISTRLTPALIDLERLEIVITIGEGTSVRRQIRHLIDALRRQPQRRMQIFELTATDALELELARMRRTGNTDRSAQGPSATSLHMERERNIARAESAS